MSAGTLQQILEKNLENALLQILEKANVPKMLTNPNVVNEEKYERECTKYVRAMLEKKTWESKEILSGHLSRLNRAIANHHEKIANLREKLAKKRERRICDDEVCFVAQFGHFVAAEIAITL